MVIRKLISERYKNDGVSLMSQNDIQKTYIKKFIHNNEIKYKTLEKCPICGHENFILIAEKDRYGISVDTVICEKCGLIFSLTQMTTHSSILFYSKYYRKIYEGIENLKINSEKYKIRGLRKIPAFLKKNNDVVVEIGTGGGWNLLKFKKNDFEHYGFDYDEKYIKFGREQYGLNLHVGGIDEAKKMGIKADYVILSHVLEHTTDPYRFLISLKEIMKDNSILNIYVPSLDFLIYGGGGTGYDLLGTLQNAHNFLFDNFTLKYLLLRCGYNIKILLGENVVATPSITKDKKDIQNIEDKLDSSFLGYKTYKYLKLCESLVIVKNKLIPNKVKPFLHYLYFFFNPFESFRKYWMVRNYK